mmetsp:Transcript_93661/g.195319  ORF Transcript_93661/g.195319 Transcript_93661/m.195319 type:complete len:231 (+) Transcript_93661:2578-3270(+)
MHIANSVSVCWGVWADTLIGTSDEVWTDIVLCDAVVTVENIVGTVFVDTNDLSDIPSVTAKPFRFNPSLLLETVEVSNPLCWYADVGATASVEEAVCAIGVDRCDFCPVPDTVVMAPECFNLVAHCKHFRTARAAVCLHIPCRGCLHLLNGEHRGVRPQSLNDPGRMSGSVAVLVLVPRSLLGLRHLWCFLLLLQLLILLQLLLLLLLPQLLLVQIVVRQRERLLVVLRG